VVRRPGEYPATLAQFLIQHPGATHGVFDAEGRLIYIGMESDLQGSPQEASIQPGEVTMTILSPSAVSGPLTVSGAPVPIATSSTLVNHLSVKPRLGQWSKVLIGGANLGTDESNAMSVLYPVPNGGRADAFVVQDQGGQNTIDLSQIYVYATIPGDTPMVEAFEYKTV